MKLNRDKERKNSQKQPWRLKAAATLISNHQSKIKIIAPSKYTFQNTGGLQMSSNVNEVIRAVINSLFFFLNRFYTHNKHKKHISKQK